MCLYQQKNIFVLCSCEYIEIKVQLTKEIINKSIDRFVRHSAPIKMSHRLKFVINEKLYIHTKIGRKDTQKEKRVINIRIPINKLHNQVQENGDIYIERENIISNSK
jgi:hypothetical protein